MKKLSEEKISAHMLNLAYRFYDDISHPLRVAENFETGSDKWILGLFHDVLEDTLITFSDLERELRRFDKEYLLKHIEKLTRKPNQEYFEYIENLEGVELEIKLRDVSDNYSRKDTLKSTLEVRYKKALEIILLKIQKGNPILFEKLTN